MNEKYSWVKIKNNEKYLDELNSKEIKLKKKKNVIINMYICMKNYCNGIQ